MSGEKDLTQSSMRIAVHGHIIELQGDFDVRCTHEVRDTIYDVLHSEHHDVRDIEIDCSGVTSIDLTAIRVLAVANRMAIRAGRSLKLRGCCPSVRRVLAITGLTKVLEVERPPISA